MGGGNRESTERGTIIAPFLRDSRGATKGWAERHDRETRRTGQARATDGELVGDGGGLRRNAPGAAGLP